MTRLRWLIIGCLALASCRFGAAGPNPPAGSYHAESFQVSGGGATETVQGAAVSDAFFSGGKLRPIVGRTFISQEYRALAQQNGSVRVAILSYSLWERKFHADAGVIGRTLQVNVHNVGLVGTLPKGFGVPPGAALWVPQLA